MEDIIRIFSGLLANDISRAFLFIIGGWFISALLILILPWFKRSPRCRTLVDLTPSILTSLGILGTFIGIFVGLLDFDVRTINKSVPILLEGLKVAFGTSIVGLGSALIFRVLKPLISINTTVEDASAQDVINAIDDMKRQVSMLDETNKAGFDDVKKALTDDGDSSVVGQLQRLRSNFADLEKTTSSGFEAQIKEFKDFAEHMSKAFSEAIIEELKSVIREFNEKISEQFGDNFKQLNEAVGQLLQWQENYKTQLEELKSAFDNSVETIGATEQAISAIEESARAIPSHMSQLTNANNQLIEQLTSMHDGLSSISEMRERAEGAIPEIASKIDKMTTTISDAVNSQSQVAEQIKDVINASTQELEGAVGKIGDQIESSLGEQREAQQQMLDGLQSALNESLQNATNHLNDAVVQLDEAMQKEIESIVTAMAESLSGIAQKFVSDYDPLLDQVRQIVEIGKAANKE